MYSSLLFLCSTSSTEKSITDSLCPGRSIDYITCSVLCRMLHRSCYFFIILCVMTAPFTSYRMLICMSAWIRCTIRTTHIATIPWIIDIFCYRFCPGLFYNILLVMSHFRMIDCMSLLLPGVGMLWFFWFRLWLARLLFRLTRFLFWFRFRLTRLLLRFRLRFVGLLFWFGFRLTRFLLRFGRRFCFSCFFLCFYRFFLIRLFCRFLIVRIF